MGRAADAMIRRYSGVEYMPQHCHVRRTSGCHGTTLRMRHTPMCCRGHGGSRLAAPTARTQFLPPRFTRTVFDAVPLAPSSSVTVSVTV